MPHDPAAVDQLVTSHLALVGHLVRETAARLPRHLDTDDLFGAGALALVQAARSFKPDLGVPFARFASTRIRGAMIDQMRQRDWATRSVRSRARAISAVMEELTKALHRSPTDAELAAASGMSELEVRQVFQGTDRAVLLSLDPLAPDDEGLAAGLADGSPRPEEALVAAERIGYLRDAIAELPGRTRMVISGYYLENKQLTELADQLGVTQSRASQLRSEGLDLLHEALSRLLGDDARAGAGAQAEPDGVRARRRESYVQAVARRSSVRDRADVQAYLDGAPLQPAGAPRGLPAGPATMTGWSTGPTGPTGPAGGTRPTRPTGATGATGGTGATAWQPVLPATPTPTSTPQTEPETEPEIRVPAAPSLPPAPRAPRTPTVQTVPAVQTVQTVQAVRAGHAVAAAAAAYSGRTRAG